MDPARQKLEEAGARLGLSVGDVAIAVDLLRQGVVKATEAAVDVAGLHPNAAIRTMLAASILITAGANAQANAQRRV